MKRRFIPLDASVTMFNTSSKTISAVTAVTVVLAISFATTTFWILLSEQAATAGLLTLDVSHPQAYTLDRYSKLK